MGMINTKAGSFTPFSLPCGVHRLWLRTALARFHFVGDVTNRYTISSSGLARVVVVIEEIDSEVCLQKGDIVSLSNSRDLLAEELVKEVDDAIAKAKS